MKEPNKKKITKKSIDIESEFIGKPVEPRKPKEKKDDLTDEIRKFLSEPITLDSIKKVFLRMGGPFSDFNFQRSKIYIYGIPHFFNLDKNPIGFIISIQTNKYNHSYYLGWFTFFQLDCFSLERLDKSRLRGDFAHALRNWLDKNLDKITILKD